MELRNRCKQLYKILESCELCPRRCKVNRLGGEQGYCRAPYDLMVSSIGPHFGEEPELVGRYGSGTIFLTHCNLRCVFCQNYDISQLEEGKVIKPEDLAKAMLRLQDLGCHNVNFVTPTHYVPQIVESLIYALEMGLNLPLVFNCGGYENVEIIKLLDRIFDIYMPDIKFFSPELSRRYGNAEDYFLRCKESILEMQRQVGNLVVEDGIARRGLIIRHLVMPNHIEDSFKILEFVAQELTKDTYVNIMDQYRPLYKAADFPEINRPITSQEYKRVVGYAKDLGLSRGFPC